MPQVRPIIKKVAALLRWGDMFSTSQFLRYRGDSDYGTVTGGFVSVAVIIVFAILFANLGIQTANRQLINSSVSQESETDPSPLKVVVGPQGGFIFMVALLGLNLNNPAISFFDITLTQSYYGPLLTPINSTSVPLEQCTAAHFAFNSDISSYFTRFTTGWALCPPINYTLNVGGRATSDIFSSFTIQVAKCNATKNPRCASDPMMAAIQKQSGGYFRLGIPMVNALINPGDQDYVKYYVEDRNVLFFTIDSQAVYAVGEIEQTKVDTDVSLMPYTNIITEYFVGVPERFNAQAIPITNNVYGQVILSKAATFSVYTRSFSKVDDYLSYVGGLVSTILLLFFVLSAYSALNYTLEVAASTVMVAPNKPVPARSFHFLHFLMVGLKDILSKCWDNLNWPVIDEFRRCRDQAQTQLDISYILSRIIFLENAFTATLKQHQLNTLHLIPKPTIDVAFRSKQKYKALAAMRRGVVRRERVSITASIELNESSQSPKKGTQQGQAQEDEEEGCNCQSDSSDDEGLQQVAGELQASFSKLLNDQSDLINCNILKEMDQQARKKLKRQARPPLTNEISIKNMNMNSFSFQEIEERPTDLNGKVPFEFIS